MFIGDKIKEHNALGDKNYVFGYEESYGCLIGDFARDKDAVQASLMFCEAADYYKKQGKTLVDVLDDLAEKFGYYLDAQSSTFFRGADGSDKMNALLEDMRNNPIKEAAGIKVSSVDDFLLNPPDGFVPSNVLRYNLEDGSFVAIRPSGTEPKIKIYYSIKEENRQKAEERLLSVQTEIKTKLGLE